MHRFTYRKNYSEKCFLWYFKRKAKLNCTNNFQKCRQNFDHEMFFGNVLHIVKFI